MLDKEDIDKLQEAIDAIHDFLGVIADFVVDFATAFCELFKDQKELEFDPKLTLTPPDIMKIIKKKMPINVCLRCHGRGEIMVREKLVDGDGSEDIGGTPHPETCPRCKGEGVY